MTTASRRSSTTKTPSESIIRHRVLSSEKTDIHNITCSVTRYAPRMRRPLSGRKHFADIIVEAEKDDDLQNTKSTAIPEPTQLSVVKNGTKVCGYFRVVPLLLYLKNHTCHVLLLSDSRRPGYRLCLALW